MKGLPSSVVGLRCRRGRLAGADGQEERAGHSGHPVPARCVPFELPFPFDLCRSDTRPSLGLLAAPLSVTAPVMDGFYAPGMEPVLGLMLPSSDAR